MLLLNTKHVFSTEFRLINIHPFGYAKFHQFNVCFFLCKLPVSKCLYSFNEIRHFQCQFPGKVERSAEHKSAIGFLVLDVSKWQSGGSRNQSQHENDFKCNLNKVNICNYNLLEKS